MTDKVQKIREVIEKRYEYWRKKEFNSHSTESEIRMSECKRLLFMVDSLQEESVSKEIEVSYDAKINEAHRLGREEGMFLAKTMFKEPVSEDLEEAMQHNAPDNIGIDDLLYWRNGFITCAKWQKTKDESTTEDLCEYINELSKQFPEVSFAKLSRIAVRAAKWQEEKDNEEKVLTYRHGFNDCKEQFEKERLKHCDAQTEEEAEREQDFVMGIIDKEHRQPTFDDAIKYGMRLQKEQIKEALLSEVLPYFMHGGEADEVVAKLDEVLNQKK